MYTHQSIEREFDDLIWKYSVVTCDVAVLLRKSSA